MTKPSRILAEKVTVTSRINVAIAAFRKAGGEPQAVHLTKSDAAQLAYEVMAAGGPVAQVLMQHGIHKAVPTILGLKVVYRSPSFGVQ